MNTSERNAVYAEPEMSLAGRLGELAEKIETRRQYDTYLARAGGSVGALIGVGVGAFFPAWLAIAFAVWWAFSFAAYIWLALRVARATA